MRAHNYANQHCSNQGLFDIMKCLYLFDLNTFQIFGQKFLQFFHCIFGKFQTPKIHSEINWPLVKQVLTNIPVLIHHQVFCTTLSYIYNVCQDLCQIRQLFNINEGLGLLKLADAVLILINPSPSNVKKVTLLCPFSWSYL